MDLDNIITNEVEALQAMTKKLVSIKKNVTDFDVNKLVKSYIAKGGYDFSLNLDDNVSLFIQMLGLMKANEKS